MPDMTHAPRPRPLWQLFIAPGLLLITAAAWSVFWFYSASRVDVIADAWRAREAQSGRVYDCAKRSVAGFPFRLEVRCEGAHVSLVSQTAGQAATQAPITARLGEILVMAQVYDPKLLIAEFTAPATISDPNSSSSMVVNWRTARSSIIGLPGIPQRVSLVFDDPALDRVKGSLQTPLLRAKHIELHGRISPGSTSDHPAIDTVLRVAGGSIQEVHPLLAEPFDAEVQAKLTGLKDFAPKPWPQRFREIQAAGGHAEIVQSRIQQGDLVAVATGPLGLTPDGRLEGELQMTVAGLEKVIPALGLEKMFDEGVPQATLDRVAPGVKTQDVRNLLGALDHAIPGLGNAVKQNVNVAATAGINALGTEAELEGKKARAFPLRFVDGAVFLGPIKVAEIPPLF
ncbi:MAG: DUF2125 domain-containing protein [Bradyrhizobium sp.]|uniref:DUF2125 domain-containing protein n=1 Tax=Bradyrhizobium sp. TaxID=376 RepID=UPI001EB8658D|nr:DUF2125 domain-containing protein [Bradyrhizobium sp.]MBU6456452.1 DUF2125 domain-containing protein [Bradyrhizobium sp.]MDE2601211.1 DUF2125 domain-containing protein [Bradyrhizobium sp.]